MNHIDLVYNRSVGYDQLKNFLIEIDDSFVPKISSRVTITDYTRKLIKNAEFFGISTKDGKIIGAILLYCNDKNRENAYIPILGVIREYRNNGIIKDLFQKVENHLMKNDFRNLSLETWKGGDAVAFYIKIGFFIENAISDRPHMGVSLKLKKRLGLSRDFFGFSPSPLTKSEGLSSYYNINLFLKRDDLFSGHGGGSKVRKSHYILKKAKEEGCNAVVTTGGIQSNHVRATAVMCAELSMQMSAIIHDSEPEKFIGNLKIASLAGANISFVNKDQVSLAMNEEVKKFIDKGLKPFYIWGGGHCVEGALAYFDAVYELKNQLYGINPDFIIVPSGTGTTQAGIEVGVRTLFPDCKVLGVSVARDKKNGSTVVIESANELISSLKIDTMPINEIFFDDTKMGTGYEAVFPELIDIIKETARNNGVILDPTYSGKAFYGMVRYIEEKIIPPGSNVIFWHTGSLLNTLASNQI